MGIILFRLGSPSEDVHASHRNKYQVAFWNLGVLPQPLNRIGFLLPLSFLISLALFPFFSSLLPQLQWSFISGLLSYLTCITTIYNPYYSIYRMVSPTKMLPCVSRPLNPLVTLWAVYIRVLEPSVWSSFYLACLHHKYCMTLVHTVEPYWVNVGNVFAFPTKGKWDDMKERGLAVLLFSLFLLLSLLNWYMEAPQTSYGHEENQEKAGVWSLIWVNCWTSASNHTTSGTRYVEIISSCLLHFGIWVFLPVLIGNVLYYLRDTTHTLLFNVQNLLWISLVYIFQHLELCHPC